MIVDLSLFNNAMFQRESTMSNKINPMLYSAITISVTAFVSLLGMFIFSTKPASSAPLLQGTPSPVVFLPLIQGNPTITGTAQINQPPGVNAGQDQSATFPASVNLNSTVTDDGLPSPAKLTIQWSKLSGPGTVTFANPAAEDTTATFSLDGNYILQLMANDGEQTANDLVNITLIRANQPPIVDAGADQLITLPGNAQLNGTVTDDGLPTPAKLTVEWSKLSGPGTATFANPMAEDTMATFSLNGEYVLQLTANDGEASTSTLVKITVNQPPTVDAGSDQTILLPASAQLNGTTSDDGLPNPPGKLSLRWSKLSGPGTVSFTSTGSEDTTATFSLAGNYTLQLTADDGAQPRSDQVQITVTANQPPTVDAGVDQTVTVLDSVALNGTVTDDSLPNPPRTLSFLWSKLSGSGLVTFTNATAEDTTATFSQAGIYVLQLTADDSAAKVSDQVTITVKSLDGIWRGNSTQNNLIAFEIKDRGFISFTTSYKIGGCGGTSNTSGSVIPLTNRSFTVEQPGANGVKIRTTGTFNSATAASGQITVTGSPCGNSTGTWTATKQGPIPTIAYAIADASVIEGAPDLNDGQDPTTWVGYEHCKNGKITRGLMKFNLEKIPSGASIAQARLHLNLYGSCDLANRSHTVTAYSVSGAWEENAVTWNTQPAFGQAYGSGSVQSRTYEWYLIDVTDLVKQWANGTLPNNGLMLRGPEGAGNESAMLVFLTREAPAEYTPYLEITYADNVQTSIVQAPKEQPFTLPIVQEKNTLKAALQQSDTLFEWEQMANQPSAQR